jgi:hypothetical protein
MERIKYYKYNPKSQYRWDDICLELDMTDTADRDKISPSAITCISYNNKVTYCDKESNFGQEAIKKYSCIPLEEIKRYREINYYYPLTGATEKNVMVCQSSNIYFLYSHRKERLFSIKLYAIGFAIALLIAIISINSQSCGGSSSKWDSLSDDEKAWYERNYGDGKSDAYDKAIEDYNKKYNSN